MLRLFAFVIVVVLTVGSATCGQPSVPTAVAVASNDDSNFRRCVDREAKVAIQRSVKKMGELLALYGYTTEAANSVIQICNPSLPPENQNDSIYTVNPSYMYLNKVLDGEQKAALDQKSKAAAEAQRQKAELDAPRIKAEKAEEIAAGTFYYQCLVRHARLLALNSNETAEIIAEASFPSCSEERQGVFDAYQRHNNTFSVGAMEVAEGKFKQSLLLEIIKARARPIPSTPKPNSIAPI